MSSQTTSPIDEKAEFQAYEHLSLDEVSRLVDIAIQLGCWAKQDPTGDVAVGPSAWLLKPFVWGLNVCASDGKAFVRVRQRPGLVWACVREPGVHELTAEAERVASGAWRAQWKRAVDGDRCEWLPWPTRLYHSELAGGVSYTTLPASLFNPMAEMARVESRFTERVENMTAALGEAPCWYRPTEPSERVIIMPWDTHHHGTVRTHQGVLVYWGQHPRQPIAEAIVMQIPQSV